MIEPPTTVSDPKQQEAINRIKAFSKRYGESHLEFARYAAFPLALTPDLLYRLRDYLLQQHKPIPWIAVADLLLSGLCSEVDEELYEMDNAVRNQLLEDLDEKQLQDLSKFFLNYVKRNFHSNITGLKQSQYWTALAYVRPGKAAAELTQTLNKVLQQPNLSQWLQKASLVETLAKPLKEAGFQPLVTLADAMKETARGNYTKATQLFNQLFNQLPKTGTSAVEIAGVTVNLPAPPVPVKTFSFETVKVNRRGKITQRETKEAAYFTEDLGSKTTLDMVYIPRGRFMMGSPAEEAESFDDEKPQHQVTVKPFFIGKYPITQAQWQAVAKLPKIHYDLKSNPSTFKGANRPVENVSWYDAVEFCAR
ncbi:MAG: formylglycine-generating enzyme family protein, partial [Microcoleus sp.]